MRPRTIYLSLLALLTIAGTSLAATPPLLINYQGVLRDNLDAPLTGPKDMVFRFYSVASGGSPLLTDSHTAAGGYAVTVSGGLFNGQLGSGTVTAGTSASLNNLFRDNATVYLEVQVSAETLSPRTRIVAAPYALNAANLEGKPASGFIDTTASNQTMAGGLTVTSLEASGSSFNGVRSRSSSGGCFECSSASGGACLGAHADGIQASGNFAGGHFTDLDASGRAYVAIGDTGIEAYGSVAGGFFFDSNGSGYGFVGVGDEGLSASGNQTGGIFRDSDDNGFAFVGYGSVGIQARGFGNHGGSAAGGLFIDTDSSIYAELAKFGHKIYGTGGVSFVQNHPFEKGRVIVYTSPEGDEVATYTRGSAKLIGGEARVRLGETFQWVTNPDIGLTALVTPRGQPTPLWVESVSTTELIVRGPEGSDATFDYMVYGLRIGFEETSVVEEKEREARIPSMASHRERSKQHSEMQHFNALKRFERMDAEMNGVAAVGGRDLSASKALHDAIEEYDPKLHGPVLRPEFDAMKEGEQGTGHVLAEAPGRLISPDTQRSNTARGALEPRGQIDARNVRQAGGREVEATVLPRASGRVAEIAAPERRVMVAVGEPVEEGDVLVVDAANPASMKRSDREGDPTVVGVVARSVRAPIPSSRVPLAPAGSIVLCKVDAGYGSIRPGDLLTTSPTTGRAMRSVDAAPGTVIGKALDGLFSGSGSIRMLVILL